MMSAAIEAGRRTPPEGQTPMHSCNTVDEHFRRTDAKEQLIKVSLEESVLHYAALARDAGLDGVVCSSREVRLLRESFGPDFLTVTPGIRLASDDVQDQKRVATPQFAKEAGASAIVVGRGITKADNPYASYLLYKEAWEGKA